jgi:hypothetical protein
VDQLKVDQLKVDSEKLELTKIESRTMVIKGFGTGNRMWRVGEELSQRRNFSHRGQMCLIAGINSDNLLHSKMAIINNNILCILKLFLKRCCYVAQ